MIGSGEADPDGLDHTDYAAYEADAAAAKAPTSDNILSRITARVRDLRDRRADVVLAEEALKAAQAAVRLIEELDLPELMKEAGQEKLRTSDGYDVELIETLRASIPAASLAQALAWLVANGQASIIKRDIRLQFGKDEDEKAQAALDLVLNNGFMPQDKQTVHPQTLAAVIREMMSAGVDVPLGLLGAHVQPGVKVKEAKKAK